MVTMVAQLRRVQQRILESNLFTLFDVLIELKEPVC